jgi:predicted O-methyltransferase YrrM
MEELDFVFIHEQADLYLKDIKLLESSKLLHKGTCIVAFNIASIPEFQNYMSYNPKYETTEIKTNHVDCRSYQTINEVMSISIF